MIDMTVSLGNILTLIGGLGVVVLYIIDTRYGSNNTQRELKAAVEQMKELAHSVKDLADTMGDTRERVARIEGNLNGSFYYGMDGHRRWPS